MPGSDDHDSRADQDDAPLTASELGLELRPMREEDYNYVLSSWLRSYAQSPEFRSTPRCVYFALYEPIVKDLVARSTIAVATMPEAPGVVLGWLAVEGEVLHYVLTKPRWRRLGIAEYLLADLTGLPATYTHAFPLGASQRLVPPIWTYDASRRFQRTAA